MDYRGGQYQQQQQRDFHLSRSFFMRKRFSNNDNTLIFHKRFLYPLVISREKCLSYLKIKGFKTWKTPFLDTLLDPTKLSNDDYSLKISIGNNETTVFIPPLIFLSEYIGDIIIFIKKYINESLGAGYDHENFLNFFHVNGLIFFKIINTEITITFGDALCKIFNFKNNFKYTKDTSESIFFYKNNFKNFKGDHVGISVNFAFSNNLSDSEMIGILSTQNIEFSSLYDKCIIDRPEKLSIRSDSIIEIEIKFINLQTGTVYRSIYENENEEIFVSMNFSDI